MDLASWECNMCQDGRAMLLQCTVRTMSCLYQWPRASSAVLLTYLPTDLCHHSIVVQAVFTQMTAWES